MREPRTHTEHICQTFCKDAPEAHSEVCEFVTWLMEENDRKHNALREMDSMGSGAHRIGKERIAQREREGYSTSHDDEHTNHEIAMAAACYAAEGTDARVIEVHHVLHYPYGRKQESAEIYQGPDGWPWPDGDKRARHPRIRQLEIAGALIAAEIDRLLRAEKGE